MSRGAQDKTGAVARATLFALLWFLATFFFFGDLGKWSDDWMVHVRNLASDSFRWRDVFALDYFHSGFLRPFHVHAVAGLQTVLWHHDRVIHLIVAATHGINSWLFWKVLRRMCVSPQAPSVGVLLFLVYPAAHEALFWSSTIGTSAGVCWFLLCTLAAQRFAAGEIGWRGLLLRVPLLLTLGWWYEQPAACAPAIALAFLACAPPSRPLSARLRQMSAIAGAAFLAGAIHASVLISTLAPNTRGGAGRIIKPGELGAQTSLILNQAWHSVRLTAFAAAALEEGWRALCSRPIEACMVGAATAAALFTFARWWMRDRSPPDPLLAPANPETSPSRLQRLAALGFGACVVVASLVPVIAVQGQWFASRLAYMPVLGLAILLTVLLDIPLSTTWAQSRLPAGRASRGLILAGLIPSVACGAIMLVGVQSVWHQRSIRDRELARELLRLDPNPVARSFFLPLEIHGWLFESRSQTFQAIICGPFEFPWSAERFVQFAYRRRDVHGLAINRWLPAGLQTPGVEGASESGIHLARGSLPRMTFPLDAAGRKIIPWRDVIAIRIVDDHIQPVDTVQILDPANPVLDRLVHLPAHPKANAADPPAPPAVISAVPIPKARTVFPEWRLLGSVGHGPSDRATAAPSVAMNQTFTAFTMHPSVETISDRNELRAVVPAMDRPRTLAMRVTMSDHALPFSDGVDIFVFIDGLPDPLVHEAITPERLRREQGWIVVRATIPAGAAPRTLRVLVDPGPAKDTNTDWCLVTPPVLTDLNPDPPASPATP